MCWPACVQLPCMLPAFRNMIGSIIPHTRKTVFTFLRPCTLDDGSLWKSFAPPLTPPSPRGRGGGNHDDYSSLPTRQNIIGSLTPSPSGRGGSKAGRGERGAECLSHTGRADPSLRLRSGQASSLRMTVPDVCFTAQRSALSSFFLSRSTAVFTAACSGSAAPPP